MPRSARVWRSRKNTTAPTIGPSMRPMPPITVMKITKAVQSLTLKAASGLIRSFCRKMSAPIMAVANAVMM